MVNSEQGRGRSESGDAAYDVRAVSGPRRAGKDVRMCASTSASPATPPASRQGNRRWAKKNFQPSPSEQAEGR